MGKIAEEFAEKQRDKLIACPPHVVRFARIDASKYASHGWALIEANAALQEAWGEAHKREREIQEELRGIPDEERDRRLEVAAQRELEIRAHRLSVIFSQPDSRSAFAERMSRVLIASVTGMGKLKPDILEAYKDHKEHPLALGKLLEYAEPAGFLEDLRSKTEIETDERPYYIEPASLVATQEEADEERNHIWIGIWSADLRIALGSRILDLQSIVDHLVPFRFGSGAGPVPGSGGAPVRGETERTAGRARSGGSAGDRPALRTDGKRSGNRGSKGR